MPVQALIADLDNTIYPVSSIGDKLFAELFELLRPELDVGTFEQVATDIKRKPFQWVAQQYSFSAQLTKRANELLNTLEWNGPMKAFSDYPALRDYPARSFLVTTGYTALQQSKVRQLGIAADFSEIHIVDPNRSNDTKKTIFQDILRRHSYPPEKVLVVGDDPASELLAGRDLGMVTVLYDPADRYDSGEADYIIRSFYDLPEPDSIP